MLEQLPAALRKRALPVVLFVGLTILILFLDPVADLLDARHIGAVLSAVGVLISILGFTLTVGLVLEGRHAVEQARRATDEARKYIRTLDALSVCTTCKNTIDEILRTRPINVNLYVLPERYSTLRQSLIELRELTIDTITAASKKRIQDTILSLSTCQASLSEYLSSLREKPPVFERMNKTLREQRDDLQVIEVKLRSANPGERNDKPTPG